MVGVKIIGVNPSSAHTTQPALRDFRFGWRVFTRGGFPSHHCMRAASWLYPAAGLPLPGCTLAHCRKLNHSIAQVVDSCTSSSHLLSTLGCIHLGFRQQHRSRKTLPRGYSHRKQELEKAESKWLPPLFPPRFRRSPTRALSSYLASGMLKSESGS